MLWRKQSALRRLMNLGRRLTHDSIDKKAQETVKDDIVKMMAKKVQTLQEEGKLEGQLGQVKGIDLKTTVVGHGDGSPNNEGKSIELISTDIDRLFERADQLLGNNGLPTAYWKRESERESGRRDDEEIKAEVIVLTRDANIMSSLKSVAENKFNGLYEKHKHKIVKLKERRKKPYEKLRLAASTPNAIPWNLPETISFRRTPSAQKYDKHLFLEKDGTFRADLGTWEREVMLEELADESVIGWLRNVDRQPWSLEIPYGQAGNMKSMYPDLLVVRKHEESGDYLFDILEPHQSNLDDNVDKARGLANFAEKHLELFGRVQLIRKMKVANGEEQYVRLDVVKQTVRTKVLQLTNKEQLDNAFRDEATTRY